MSWANTHIDPGVVAGLLPTALHDRGAGGFDQLLITDDYRAQAKLRVEELVAEHLSGFVTSFEAGPTRLTTAMDEITAQALGPLQRALSRAFLVRYLRSQSEEPGDWFWEQARLFESELKSQVKALGAQLALVGSRPTRRQPAMPITQTRFDW